MKIYFFQDVKLFRLLEVTYVSQDLTASIFMIKQLKYCYFQGQTMSDPFTLKIRARRTFQKSVNIYKPTLHHILEDLSFHIPLCLRKRSITDSQIHIIFT